MCKNMLELNDLIKRVALHDEHVLHPLRHKIALNMRVIDNYWTSEQNIVIVISEQVNYHYYLQITWWALGQWKRREKCIEW